MTLRLLRSRTAPLRTLSRRYTSEQAPLRMPADMPREDYAGPAAYALGTLGKVVKYIVYTSAGLAVTGFAAYEGVHLYIENVSLASATRSRAGDAGWEDENLPFTGGLIGGTDPRLGWKGRHALRGAYIAWEMGAGEAAAAAIQKRAVSVHPDLKGTGMIGTSASRVDRGYELAEEYIDVATAAAQQKGIAFPPELDAARPAGPPTAALSTPTLADPTALDLLSLKAGILERMNTPETRAHAKEIYERVLAAEPTSCDVEIARVVRLAHKIGDLALASGDRDEAQAWWEYGLRRAGVEIPETVAGPAPSTPTGRGRGSWWWPFASSSAAPVAAPTSAAAIDVTESPASVSPSLLRASTAILIGASAYAAQTGDLPRAAALQDIAVSLLPAPTWTNGRLALAAPSNLNKDETLQSTWEASRAALLELHRASVAHARKDKTVDALELATTAAEHAEAVLATLTPTIPTAYTARGAATAQPAARLLRDTLMTAAEAQYTSAILQERAAAWAPKEDRVHRLEHASEAFERAMSLSAAEDGSTDTRAQDVDDEGVARSEDWRRFYRGYVRTREKIMKLVVEEREGKQA